MVDVDSIVSSFRESGLITDTSSHSDLQACNSEFVCSNCQSDQLYEDQGTMICSNCAYVSSQTIDNSAEWRFYGIEDSKHTDPNRCGMPTNPLFPTSSLGSVVGNGGGYMMHRVRKFHSWNNGNYKERSLYKIFQDILSTASRHGILLTVIRESNLYYKKVSENHISRGSNRTGLIAACLFMACKAMSVPRSAKEISEIFDIETKSTIKGCKRFNEIWARIGEPPIEPREHVRPSDFIERFASKLNLSSDHILAAVELCDQLYQENVVCELSPSNIAAAVLLFVLQEEGISLCKRKLCESTNTSLITVNKCFKKIQTYLNASTPAFLEVNGDQVWINVVHSKCNIITSCN